MIKPVDPRPGHPPDRPDPPSRPDFSWGPYVTAVLLVLGCSAALLLTGHRMSDALLASGGMALTGNEVARRILADASALPTVIVGSAVTAFGAVLLTMGYDLPHAALGAGIAGLVAGEIAGQVAGRGVGTRGGAGGVAK